MTKLTDVQQQYVSTGNELLPIKPKDPNAKLLASTDSKLKNLETTVTEQNKIIKKLQRDVSRLKDQISELAGKISRG
jgi:peptidoglycan hydrolase CwlO-like protein